MFDLKPISASAIPAALEKAERYRLLNEPAAAGAFNALKKAGKEKNVVIVSVDGGCQGVKDVVPGR